MRAPEAVPFASPPPDVRHGVRRALTAAAGFSDLDPGDRREIAHALVRIAHAARLLEREAREPATPPAPGPRARALDAGDELSGAAVDRMAGTTRRMINAISFPRFVNELISGVFRAMVETNQQQLQQYVELVRGVSQSLDGFASLGGGDDMARRWLAERFPQSFRLEEPDPEDVRDAQQEGDDEEPESARLVTAGPAPKPEALRAALGLEPDAEVPSGGGEALVAFVRRSLARNRQQMLATMIQMGMQRIVVDSGRINAAMRFHIDASSAAAEDRSSRFDTRTTIGASGSVGFGPWSASASVNSTIGYVSTTDVSTREELNASADLNSSVEIHFRTDQVPLDRIASQQTVDRLRLNTLNPERELDIARQADDARMANRRAIEATRAGRPRLEGAPQATASTPASPAIPGTSGKDGGGKQADGKDSGRKDTSGKDGAGKTDSSKSAGPATPQTGKADGPQSGKTDGTQTVKGDDSNRTAAAPPGREKAGDQKPTAPDTAKNALQQPAPARSPA